MGYARQSKRIVIRRPVNGAKRKLKVKVKVRRKRR